VILSQPHQMYTLNVSICSIETPGHMQIWWKEDHIPGSPLGPFLSTLDVGGEIIIDGEESVTRTQSRVHHWQPDPRP